MEEVKTLITKLIAEKYPQFKVALSKSEIKIFRGRYFYTSLKQPDKEFRITVYTGLLAHLLNRSFKQKITHLKSDLESVLLNLRKVFIVILKLPNLAL